MGLKGFVRRGLGITKIQKSIHSYATTVNRLHEDLRQITRERDDAIHKITTLEETRERYERIFPYLGAQVPLFLMKDARLQLKIDAGVSSNKAFVISQPKSGTYLTGAILEEIGLISCEVHVDENGFSDYRWHSIRDAVEMYLNYRREMPLSDSIRLVRPGQFLVGHLAYCESTAELVSDFRIIFCFREMRTSLISWMRFFMNPRRGEAYGSAWKETAEPRQRMRGFLDLFGAEALAFQHKICGWHTVPRVMPIKFEELSGGKGAEVQRELVRSLAHFVGTPIEPGQADTIIRAVFGKETMTWSGGVSRIEEYWSSECERWFVNAGGNELNQLLGYTDNCVFR